MKILVTGAAGYIGSVVSERLLSEGHTVYGIDNFENSKPGGPYPGITFQEGSILDRDWLIDYMKANPVDAVFHFAAEALIAVSMENPGRAFNKNVTGSINLVEAMRQSGVQNIIFSSTAAVYGTPRNIPILEDDPLEPVNAYGESKLAFERMLRWYADAHDLRHVSFRYFNACGATESRGEDRVFENHLIPIALDAALGRRESLAVFGSDYPTHDGTCVRDYIHVSDIAEAHILGLKHMEKANGKALSLGNGKGYSILEVIDSVKRVTGNDFKVVMADRRPGDPPTLIASYDRVRELLGWNPQIAGLDEMVESAYKWRLAHPNGYATVK